MPDKSPVFAVTPQLAVAVLTTATGATELGTAAPTNAILWFTTGAGGSFFERFKVKNREGAPTAGVFRIFMKVGSLYYIIHEIALPTGSTPSATVLSDDSDWQDMSVKLPASTEIYCTITQTKNHNAIAEYQDLAA